MAKKTLKRQKERTPLIKAATEHAEQSEPATLPYALKNVWPSRLVISGDKTPSGTRYDVDAGQIINLTDERDYLYLKELHRKQQSCCGGNTQNSFYYFSEVLE